MRKIWLVFVLLAGLPGWCQEDIQQPTSNTADESPELRVPPPVSGQAYPSTFLGQEESNYLRMGFTLTSAYTNNVTGGTPPVGSMSFTLWPTIGLDRKTERLSLLLNYSPGYTFYTNASPLNQGNQNLGLDLQYRLSPYLSMNFHETYQKTSNYFNQPNPLNGNSVSGSAPISQTPIIIPAGDQTSNISTAGMKYQLSENGMIGGSATYSTLGYARNDQTASGLFNAQTESASGFYSKRINQRYYAGASYQYQNSLSFAPNAPSTKTVTNSVFGFLTVYLQPNFSVSVSAGPLHYSSYQAPLPVAAAWQPYVDVSASWRGERTTISADYAHTVSGGGGLNGTFQANTASASLGWRATRNWTADVGAAYSNNSSLTPYFFNTTSGGHGVSGTVALERAVGQRMTLQFGYGFAHQVYSGVEAISNTPNISHVFLNLHFTLDRPLQ